jgi:hypothetical protein
MYKSLVALFLTAFTVKFCSAQNKDSLYVFVGERISVHKFKQHVDPPTVDPKTGDTLATIIFDESFKARYRVVQNVYNKYDKDKIEFEAFDHYGRPRFSKYKYVLLFVFKSHGKFYHSKYLYFEVHPTKDGRWASACNLGSTMFVDDLDSSRAKAVPLEFRQPLSFKLKKVIPKARGFYCEPYFRIKDNKAIPLKGTYVEDLFKIQAEGTLKARGYFK